MTPEILTMLDGGIGVLCLVQLRALVVELRALTSRVDHIERTLSPPPPAVAAVVAA
jgi:hypothetical protein